MVVVLPRAHPRFDAHEILPGLWQGAHVPEHRGVREAGFDALVCCAVDRHPNHKPWSEQGVEFKEIHALFDDSLRPTPQELRIAVRAGMRVADLVLERNAKILVTCNQGRNRSGLVVGIATMRLIRCPAREAIDLIRYCRPCDALANRGFVSALESLKWK